MPHPVHRIVTHAGAFHADEVMAIALLEHFYLARPVVVADLDRVPGPAAVSSTPWRAAPFAHANPYAAPTRDEVRAWLTGAVTPPPTGLFGADGTQDCRTPVVVVRTRDPSLLNAAKPDPTVFVIDVGAECDPDRLNFDHHQSGFHRTWPDGAPLSSTGLVWSWLRANGHLKGLDPVVADDLEERLVRPLDAHDNGVAPFPLAAQMAPHNRTGSNQSQDLQFERALTMMREALDNAIHGADARLEATRVLTDKWAQAARRGVPYVILDQPSSYTDCTTLLRRISQGQAHLLALPGKGRRWSVISVAGDTHFSVKCPCPADWRGKFDTTVSLEGRSVMIRHAHKSGFMCVVEGTRGDVQAVCRAIIQSAGLNQTLPHHKSASAAAPPEPAPSAQGAASAAPHAQRPAPPSPQPAGPRPQNKKAHSPRFPRHPGTPPPAAAPAPALGQAPPAAPVGNAQQPAPPLPPPVTTAPTPASPAPAAPKDVSGSGGAAVGTDGSSKGPSDGRGVRAPQFRRWHKRT